MRIKLAEWNQRNFAPPLSLRALRRLATDHRINPRPVKLGGHWYVEEGAELIVDEVAEGHEAGELDDPVVVDILRARA